MIDQPPLKRIQVSIFLISGALIAYEILLIKTFSIQYWYHFAHLIISVALLGFGASGTFIYLFRKRLEAHYSLVIYGLPLLMLVSIWINIYLNRLIAFNPLMIVWQMSEIIKFSCLCLTMFVPFFLAAVCIGLSFSVYPGHIYRVYFSNLFGSGLGPLLILPTFFHFGPYEIILMISVVTVFATFPVSRTHIRKAISLITLLSVFPLYFIFLHGSPVAINIFKDLPQAENLTNSRIENQTFGPLGLVSVIDSPAYHYLPDLSLNCPYPLPEQKGLFSDGNTVGSINRFSGDVAELRFMDCRINAIPYKLLTKPKVLIIGGGGGTEILNAKYHGAKSIYVVEMNRDIVHLLQDQYSSFSGNIYNPEQCHILIEDGRGYLEKTRERFDLINMSLLESVNAAGSGVYSLNENYLFTTEAFITCLNRLNPGGLISISRWIKNPPRESIKLIAMAIDALDSIRPDNASRSLIVIRSWQVVTLLIKDGTFSREEIKATLNFCDQNLCDLCYYPGIKKEETNRINRMDESYFFIAAKSLLSQEKEKFYNEYPFYIRPATDNKPFFSSTFKIEILKKYFGAEGRMVIPFMDWGYLLVWIGLIILFLISMIIILAPLHTIRPVSKGIIIIFIYFGSLGLAYISLEISFLQQFIQYLYDPVFSATVVITSFLVYSGIGCIIGEKLQHVKWWHMMLSIVFITVFGIFYVGSDLFFQRILSDLPLWLRMIICSLLIAPLAIPMGIPFPSGLNQLRRIQEGLIPWAWGINGFFSVIGSSIAVLIAIAYGFESVILSALALYIICGFLYAWMCSEKFTFLN